MIFYGLSDVGLHRQNNQDSFGYLKIAENAEIFVVCDGMGGANGGNIASETAARVFTEYLGNALGQFVSPDTGMLDLPEDTELFVTPRDIDTRVRDSARLVGYAIDLALHDALTIEDIDMFLA